MKVIGLLGTLFLAVMVANACVTVIFLLAVVGLLVGLFTNTAETLTLIGGAVMIWLMGEYPIAAGILFALGLIGKVIEWSESPADKS